MSDNNAHGDILIQLTCRYIAIKATLLGTIYQVSTNIDTKSLGIQEL